MNGLAECGAVDLWKRCVDGGQAEGGAWGDRDRDRDRDRPRGGAGVGGGGGSVRRWLDRGAPHAHLRPGAHAQTHTDTHTRPLTDTPPRYDSAAQARVATYTLSKPRPRPGRPRMRAGVYADIPDAESQIRTVLSSDADTM